MIVRNPVVETVVGGRPCRIGTLGPAARHAVLTLQEEGLGDLMFPISPAEVDHMLTDQGGRIVGAEVQGRLAAFFAILLPGRSPDNLGRDVGLPDAALDHVAHWTAVVVRPDLRGHGLQRRLMAATLEAVLPPPRVRHWFATARVENAASVRSFLSAGLSIVKVGPKYDGHDRYLFRQDFSADANAHHREHAFP